MDLNEAGGKVLYRHPWELSRTYCVLKIFSKYLGSPDKEASYINVGAGDLYFDKILLKRYKNTQVHAVDIAYDNLRSKSDRIHKYHFLEEIKKDQVDYAIMMDVLEYMEDDVDYIRKMTARIKGGGSFLITLPAFSWLFSDHDIHVKNLRRYDRESFSHILEKIPELEKMEEQYFYTSLFVVRVTQKILKKVLHTPIDPKHKITAYWNYPQMHIVTRFLTGCLNLDFWVSQQLSKLGISVPGLSMLVICRKR